MEQKIILAIVIFVSLLAHVWIYRWIKFKMDEGAVLRYLKDLPTQNKTSNSHGITTEIVSSALTMREARVKAVCEKSAEIKFEAGLCSLLEEET
jgi:hypothetical protein